MQWETVIGLEIHVQLLTKSKIFSDSSTTFGAEANTQANEIDLGFPGTLPVANLQAFKHAIMFGLAINADIEKESVFERKNYFYPDLPKGYQTTQLEKPIVGKGYIEIPISGSDESKKISIHHAHLEEDAGKSLHEDFRNMSGIDLNRAGTPLIEIVTEPDLRSAEEAITFLKKIHSIVTYLKISDGNMSQGSLRCDANVSIRPLGEKKLGTRTEIKNLNSFKFIEKAIKVECQRQQNILEDGGSITQETRLYDSEKNETRSMRSKEEANDYRYFPCPDLLPVKIDQETLQELKENMPELPDERLARFKNDFGLSAYDAGILTEQRETADYFEATVKYCGNAKLAANWIIVELTGYLNKQNLSITESPISEKQIASLISRIKDGSISGKIAKEVFEYMTKGEGSPDEIIKNKNLKQVSDTATLEGMIDEIMKKNNQQVEQFRAASPEKQKKLIGFFVGQIMKLSKGQANPGEVNKLLSKKLN
jgi:aspartyl-tRNA(Asn)/glutamyl-tRNA(Gln) amidotransferase subunit B